MPLKGLTPGSFASFPSPKLSTISGGSNIKSIQSGVGSLSSGTSVNIAISQVDLTKSVVIINYFSTGGATNSTGALKIELTSATQITITRNAAGTSDAGTYAWQVIEYYQVKSLQTGTYALSTTLGTSTISAVNLSKSILYFSNTDAVADTTYNVETRGYLSNSTTITFEQNAAISKSVAWQVIEFN